VIDKKKAEKEIIDGQKAKQLLREPMIVDAINGMRESVYHNIRTSHYSRADEREDLYKMLKAIDSFELELKRRIDKGKKARSMLDKLFNKGD
jgi:hypothetical protein